MIMHSADRKINFTERSGYPRIVTAGDGLFLGVDVGTSATRVSLVRPDGSGVPPAP